MKPNNPNRPVEPFDPSTSPTVAGRGPIAAMQIKAGRKSLGEESNYPRTSLDHIREAGKGRLLKVAAVGATVGAIALPHAARGVVHTIDRGFAVEEQTNPNHIGPLPQTAPPSNNQTKK